MKIATTLNYYFAEIILSLNLFKWPWDDTSLANNRDITDSIALKFHNHSKILK